MMISKAKACFSACLSTGVICPLSVDSVTDNIPPNSLGNYILLSMASTSLKLESL